MKTLVTNIGQLVTPLPGRPASRVPPVLDVRERCEILVDGGRIAAIDRLGSARKADSQVDAGGGVVLPGLVDPHTHFALPEADVTDPASGLAEEAARRTAVWPLERRLRRALIDGVTTVEVKCAGLAALGELFVLLRSDTKRFPTVIPTLFAAAPRPGGAHATQMSALISEAIPTARRRRLARFCDVECGDGAFKPEEARTVLRAARAAGLQLTLHAGDGRTGRLGAVVVELGVTAIGHVHGLDAGDAKKWQAAGAVPVVLPGDSLTGHPPLADVRAMLEAGIPVGLGTDGGAAPIGVGSMWMTLALGVRDFGLSLEQAITAVTLYNATALDLASEIGTVELGKRADLLILDLSDYRELLAGLGENPTVSVLREGQVVYRR